MLFRSHLRALADGAAEGAVAPVRRALQALAAEGAGALPAGLQAQLEADLRQYDFGAIEARVRERLDEPDPEDDPGPRGAAGADGLAQAPSKEDIPS